MTKKDEKKKISMDEELKNMLAMLGIMGKILDRMEKIMDKLESSESSQSTDKMLDKIEKKIFSKNKKPL
jgi:hypothetical protein